MYIPSPKLTWKLTRGLVETAIHLKGAYFRFDVSLADGTYPYYMQEESDNFGVDKCKQRHVPIAVEPSELLFRPAL